MLNFRNTNIIFSIACIILLSLDFSFGISNWYYFPLVTIYSTILIWGSSQIHSNFYTQVHCKGKTDKKELSITFDDGPHETNTPQIIELLRKNNISATFFCTGKQINAHPDLLRQIDEGGHLIGNHTYSHHFLFDLFQSKKMLQEMKEVDDLTYEIINKKLKLFRPPYGVTNPNLVKAIKNGGYTPIGWSKRSLDSIIKNEETFKNKIQKGLSPGDVILFHDTSEVTVKNLQSFIDFAKNEGFSFVRLDKLLNVQAYG
jgi:peptidoglycan-N-acetylglucosamine deacetylase